MQPITLPISTPSDLETLFVFQQDADAIYLAAFTPKDPNDKAAYIAKYSQLLQDPNIHQRTIIANGTIVGSIAKYVMHGDAEITYWIDKKFWQQGIATAALQQFLQLEPTRPLYGRTAFDNIGSQRVLEKCGFEKIGTDVGFANARQAEIEEYIFRLAE
jgi:[ribosomal protein S5]-alanine N-acetyltransferase